ncbi:MAG: DNA polymerase II [Motiliproteus sp.]
MTDLQTLDGFVLTQHYRQGDKGVDLNFWIHSPQGPALFRQTGQELVFFVRQQDMPQVQSLLTGFKTWRGVDLALKDFHSEAVSALYFRQINDYREAIARLDDAAIAVYEGDVRPGERFLMERFIKGGIQLQGSVTEHRGVLQFDQARARAIDFTPRLRVLSFDIETSLKGEELYSIGLSGVDYGKQSKPGYQPFELVLMKGEGEDTPTLRYSLDEHQLLRAFIDQLNGFDPDMLVGWNVINFDLRFLQRKAETLSIPLNIGRHNGRLQLRESGNFSFATLPGRVVVDGIDCLKGATFQFESYALDNVARELLGRGKKIDSVDHRGEEITRLFRTDKPALAAYNLEDCRLVLEIFAKADLIHYLIARSHMTGLPLDKVGGSSAAFDNLYLPQLHRQGYVAPVYASGRSDLASPGGYVMDSLPGLYQHVLVLDFKSLYPSIIRTFKIDPMGLVEGLGSNDTEQQIPGFNQACYHRHKHILPGLLESLWQQRDLAKADGNKSLSQAIKIIMNSFYGVLGSPQCRFFDQRLSGSITLRGHQILTESRDYIQQQGYQVIYGDTDSIFVWLNCDGINDGIDQLGQSLAERLNQWWQQRLHDEFGLETHLEIEYETHYQRFLMPTIRGSEKGSKKRYAGLISNSSGEKRVVFKGLESVRSDWTPLARQFQQELYRRVFNDEPYAEYVKATVAALLNGEMDEQLVYHKRLRQPLDAYVKSQPPHVRAARLQERYRHEQGLPALYKQGGRVAYIMTVNGPEPLGYLKSTIDYGHYLDKQLEPVADGVLPFLNDSFAELTGRQIQLF